MGSITLFSMFFLRRNVIRATTLFVGVISLKVIVEPYFMSEVMDVIAMKRTEAG
jgi:hypothetical protein